MKSQVINSTPSLVCTKGPGVCDSQNFTVQQCALYNIVHWTTALPVAPIALCIVQQHCLGPYQHGPPEPDNTIG